MMKYQDEEKSSVSWTQYLLGGLHIVSIVVKDWLLEDKDKDKDLRSEDEDEDKDLDLQSEDIDKDSYFKCWNIC